MKTKITFIVVGLVTVIVLTSVESTRAETWTQKADIPTGRVLLASSAVDGKIYAIGGLTVYGGTDLATVEVYDPTTDTWTQKADMPTPRGGLATSVVNGKIYAIGGGSDDNKVEEYDPATDTWTQRADMPTPRGGLATSVVNGKIYAIGGGPSKVMVATVEEYDPVTDTWTQKADMPTARKLLSSSVVNGKIYAVGGQSPSVFPAFPTVEEYDPVTDTWTKKADMPTPRNWMSTSVVDKKIYAFGGNTRRGGNPISTLTQYEPATDTWTVKDDMPVRMGGLSTSVVGGKIYVIGGTSASYPYSTSLTTVWEYDTGLGVPSPDFNGDGIVDGADMSIMVEYWHTDNALYDIAPLPFGDDIVDVQDLVFLSEHLFEEVDDPTLVAHWALDEAEGIIAADSVSENGNSDGIVIGDPVWLSSGGQMNGAIQLDGVDDCIIASPFLNPADGPFSVLAWVNGGAPGQVVVSQQGAANWLTVDADGNLMTELKGTGRSTGPLFSETVIIDGQWHRIGFVWDGSKRMLYVDGMVVAEDTQPDLDSSQMGLYIGVGKDYATDTFFSGLIDDVRVYNRVVHP